MNNPRILVVEDEFVVSMALAERLTSMGYQVVGSAASGKRALELVAQHNPDLVLMDIRLQGEMDGIDTAHEVRKRFRIPVIFLTAYSEDSTLERAKLTEPFGFILKPFENRELKSAIEIALHKHRAEQEIFRLNRLYDVLSQVNQAVVRVTSQKELFDEVCQVMVERGNIDLAWIGWLDADEGKIHPVAQFGKDEKLILSAAQCAFGLPDKKCNPGRAILEDEPQICNDCAGQHRCCSCEHAPGKSGLNSRGSFPIHFQGRVCGVLILGVAQAGYFQEREINLLKEVVLDISFALEKMEGDYQRNILHEENQRQLVFVQSLVDAIPFPVFYKDTERRFLGCNREYEQTFGINREEILGKTVFDFCPTDLALIYDNADSEILASNEEQVYESQIEVPGGGRRDIVFHKAVFKNPDGQPRGIIGVLEDVTERKLAEARVRESEEKFFVAFNHAPVMATITSLEDGTYLDVNKKFIETSGFTREEVIGKTSVGIGLLQQEDRTRLLEAFAKRSNIPGMEFTTFAKSGSPVQCLYHCEQVTIGGVKRLLTMALDISERKRAEEALRESEERYRGLFETMVQGVFYLDTNGRILDANPAALKIHGVGLDEIMGQTTSDPGWKTIHEDGSDFPGESHPSRVALRTGRQVLNVVLGVYNKRLRDYRWLSINAVPRFKPGESTPFQAYSIFEDITERRQVETQRRAALEALRKSESVIRGITDSTQDAILMMDLTGRITFWNPAAEKIFGYPTEEGLGCPLHKLLAPHHYMEAFTAGFARFQETGQSEIIGKTVELQARRKNGDEFPIELSLSSIQFEDGLHVVGIIRDITERKEAEKTLRLNEEKYRTLFQSMNQGVLYKDFSGMITEANPAALEMLGIEGEEFLGHHPEAQGWDILLEDGTQCPPEAYPSTIALRTGKPVTDIILGFYNRKKTTRTWMAVSAIPQFQSGEESPYRVFVTLHDITERRKAQAMKERLEEQLRHAQQLEAIGVLAGGIAHDFNNILSPIIGYSELALETLPEDHSVSRNLKRILTAANRAKELVKQILYFGRKGGDQLMRPIDISTVVKEALKLLRASLPSSIEIVQNIRPATILGDATQIHQVVVNLCTNAAHAMQDVGTLSVSLSEEFIDLRDTRLQSIPGLVSGNYARLSVMDTGSGMSEDTMRRVFEPYFTTKEIGKGTGLGLSVVHGIVKKHGGEVVVRSEIGKGSTFDVYIPISAQQVGQKGTATSPLPRGSERILLVDDEPAIVDSWELILEQLGYQVSAMTSPGEALELFRNNPERFDLIISDYTMPKMVGTALARECLKVRPDIPVIICTGFNERMTGEEIANSGIRALAIKPLDSEKLATIVKQALESIKTA